MIRESKVGHRWIALPWIGGAFAAVLIAGVVMIFLPGQETEDGSGRSGGDGVISLDGASAILIAISVLIAAVPLILGPRLERPATTGAAVVLLLWCLISLASVGLFFIPAALLMVVAAVMSFQGRPAG